MRTASLYDCFERHLFTLSIEHESEEGFITVVVEKYLVNMGGLGFHFNSHAEDTFIELCDVVKEMLKKKIYGHMNVNEFRSHLRNRAAA
jgi:hypothetical protein